VSRATGDAARKTARLPSAIQCRRIAAKRGLRKGASSGPHTSSIFDRSVQCQGLRLSQEPDQLLGLRRCQRLREKLVGCFPIRLHRPRERPREQDSNGPELQRVEQLEVPAAHHIAAGWLATLPNQPAKCIGRSGSGSDCRLHTPASLLLRSLRSSPGKTEMKSTPTGSRFAPSVSASESERGGSSSSP